MNSYVIDFKHLAIWSPNEVPHENYVPGRRLHVRFICATLFITDNMPQDTFQLATFVCVNFKVKLQHFDVFLF